MPLPPQDREIIDFLALILKPEIYQIFHLPDPPPDVLRTLVQDAIKGMSAVDQKQALARVKNLTTYTNTVVQVLSAAGGATRAA
jgi:hypothetical protein